MRDLLTALAGLVILILTAALVAPPFMDWDARRGDVEAALARATGAEIGTEGPLSVRLLPSPRIEVGRLRIGGAGPLEPTLLAEDVVAEIALAPLLRGETRFTAGRAARAELRIPTGGDGAGVAAPAAFAPGGEAGAAFAFDDLRAGRLTIVAVSPDAAEARRLALSDVALSAQTLGGPYRVEGAAEGVPFRLAAGRFDAAGAMQLRLVAGADGPARIEADGILTLSPRADGLWTAALAGRGRLALAPARDGEEPAAIASAFATGPDGLALSELSIEIGEAGLGPRLEGSGLARFDDPRLALVLSSRRVVAERALASPIGAALRAAGGGRLPIPLDLTLSLDALSLAGEEIAGVSADLSIEGASTVVRAAAATLPGRATVGFSGEADLAGAPAIAGRASLVAEDTARLARFLRRLGADGPLLAPLDGRRIALEADVALRDDVLALSDMRLEAGASALGGSLRFTPARGGARALVEAEIEADGVDVAALPRLAALGPAASDVDVVLTVDARDVRFEGAQGAGRIRARLASSGDGLVVDALDVTDLAGATASVSGRIGEDGTGRIEGRLSAERAEPLIALLGSVAFGDGVALIPTFLREGGLDVALTLERFAPAAGEPGLRTAIDGIAAGGPIAAQWLAVDGRTERLEVELSTQDTRRWLDVDHPLVAGRPSLLALTLGRSGPDRYVARLAADVAGLRLDTPRPLSLDAIDLSPHDGEIALSTPDVRPALALLAGRVVADVAVPAQLRASLRREGPDVVVEAGGALGEERISGVLRQPPGGEPTGEINLTRLSLPWLLQTFALGPVAGEAAGPWPRVAFGPMARPLERGSLLVRARALDLGGGFVAGEASLRASLLRDGVSLTEVDAAFGDGRVSAQLAARRPTAETASLVGEVALADVALDAFAQGLPVAGRLTGTLGFGGAGESLAAIVGALAGQGRFAIDGLTIAGADPAAIPRALDRALQEEDPLGGRRLLGYMEAALDEGALAAERVEAPATLVNGVVALTPLAVGAGAEPAFAGGAQIDLRAPSLDLSGFLRAPAAPQGWSGPAPAIGLSLRGPPGAIERAVDVGPLTNGLAAIVLQRELARIEAFEREASERARRQNEARLVELRRARAEEWRAEVERRRLEEAARRGAAEALRRDAEAGSLAALAAEEARRAQAERLAAEARRLAEEEARIAAELAARRAAAEEEARRRAAEEAARAAPPPVAPVAREPSPDPASFDADGIRRLLEELAAPR